MANPDSTESAKVIIGGNESKPDRAAIAKQRSDAGTPGQTRYNVDLETNVKPPAPRREFDADGNPASSTLKQTTLSKP